MNSALMIISILSFAFGILSTIGIYFGSTAYFVITLAACTAVCIPASLVNKRFYRIIISLLPFLTLLIPKQPATIIACGLACAVFAVYMSVGSFLVPYYKCRRVFLILMTVMLLISLVTDLVIIITPQAKEYLNLQGVCVFLLCMLFSGVLTLRSIRAGEASAGLRWNLFNFSSLAATVAVLASAAIVLYLAFSFLFSFIKPLEERDLPDYKSNPAQYESNNHYTPLSGIPMGNGNAQSIDDFDNLDFMIGFEEEEENYTVLMIVCSVITAASIAVLILLRHSKRPQDKDDMQFEKEMHSRPDYTNRQKIRLYFRTYMAGRGIDFSKGSTSEDVASGDTRKEASRLREIYIRARYSVDSEISDAEVLEARNCLEKCQKNTDKQ